MKSFLASSLAVLFVAGALAGDTLVNVEHGDGHVDNTNSRGHFLGGNDLEHTKVHHGLGHSREDLEDDFGVKHRDDIGNGDHETHLHEDNAADLPHNVFGGHGDHL
ncbi:Uncharacterized protein PBTT_05948 [Plasmodiophora brassicae]|uniref:Uncharacterized protein n=1 Tax=Plasmodiophora brassicae TaxID=37360 RepID=A0A0G4J2Y6_PLABS|nr:hypothetical protein PBRA_002200 [Plasmodiophora brassicae]SPQ98796.1 unnamed protein product [Plasmodiophora brassicae]